MPTLGPASNCHGYNCPTENQRCLSGAPGSNSKNWTCRGYQWIPDYLDKERIATTHIKYDINIKTS